MSYSEWDEPMARLSDLAELALKFSPILVTEIQGIRQLLSDLRKDCERQRQDLDALVNAYETVLHSKDQHNDHDNF
jgi:hypothetical protein